MTEKVAAQFKKLLLARRLELSRKLVHTREETQAGPALADPDSANSTHCADPEFSQQSMQVRELLMAMDAALARIASGTFGECMTCGEEIGSKRLVAFPWTSYCLGCQNASRGDTRPVRAK
jgi:DnaK suppressor protein